MEWSEELLRSHRSLSEVDVRFREQARRDPELLSRATFLALDEDYQESRLQLQPWPLFVGDGKLAELRHASVGLSRLVRAIPERIFDDDPARIGPFYGLDPALAATALAPPTGIESALSRGDFVDSVDGFKCLEFNYFANLGGWETALAAELHQRIPATVRFLREAGVALSYTDTLKVLFSHLVEEVHRKGLAGEGSLNIAFVVRVDLAAPWAGPLLERELKLALRRRGSPLQGRVFLCRYEQLREGPGGLWLGDRKIQAVAEILLVGGTAAPALRCFKAGQLVLMNGPIARILGDKQNLGLLSEYQDSGLFTPEEAEIIERHLPWTRIVSARSVTYRGEEIFLPDLLVARREGMVLKAARSMGSQDVHLGRETPADAWADLVRDVLGDERRWVAQEHVESRPYLFQDGEHGCAPHAVVWGPFVFGDQYGGVFVRVKPAYLEGPISLDRGGSTGLVLEV